MKTLEQINVILRIQHDDGLLPMTGQAHFETRPPRFAPDIGSTDIADPDIVYPLNGILDLSFVGLRMDLKWIGVQGSRTASTLLGNQRPNNHLVPIHY